MNPSPQQVWLRDYLLQTAGSLPSDPIDRYILTQPTELPPQRGNPVDRPAGVVAPTWFDCLETAAGQRLASKLGEHSGYVQEFVNWAPSVSYLYDLTVYTAKLLAHDDTPAVFRDALFPAFYVQAAILEQQVGLLDVHCVHAEHQGTALEGAWKALQTDLRFQGASRRYRAGTTSATLERIHKELLAAQIKQSTKAAASRTPPPRGKSGGRGASSRGPEKPAKNGDRADARPHDHRS